MSTQYLIRRMFAKVFQRPGTAPERKRSRIPGLGIERLEDRLTPTATLYVDFGDAFPNGKLSGTSGDFETNARGPSLGRTGDPADTVVIESFNSVQGAKAAETRSLAMARIRQQYKPFDITVVDLTATPQMVNGHSVTAASSFQAMAGILAANKTDAKNFDAYIVVGRFTVAGTTSLGYGGLAAGTATIGSSISQDGGGMIQLDARDPWQRVASVVTHEAGHVFGLNHVYQSGNGDTGQDSVNFPGTTINARDFYVSDEMAYTRDRFGPLNFFTRYPTLDGGTFKGNTYDVLSSTKQSPAQQLIDDPNIGPGKVEYVTGTGLHDDITITKTSGTTARVVVTAFRDADRKLPIPVPGSKGTRTDFVYDIKLNKPLMLLTGAGTDRVRIIGGPLGTPVEYDLGDGPNDTIEGLDKSGDKIGANITSATFTGTAKDTFDKVRLTFSEAVQPSTVNATNVTIAGPAGAVAVTGITPVANSTGTLFDVTFAPQAAAGKYTLNSGVDILDLAGNKMDQNLNAVNGEGGVPPTGDQYTASASLGTTKDVAGANVAGQFFGVAAGTVDRVTLTFNEVIQASSLTAQTVTVTGPNGAIPILGITRNTKEDSSTAFDVTFLPQFAGGKYTLTVRETVLDAAGNKMDQNKNGTNGEAGVAPAGDQATISTTQAGSADTKGPQILAADFAGDNPDTFNLVRVVFNEPIDATKGFTAASVVSVTDPTGKPITVTAVTAVPGTTDEFDVKFATQTAGGTYTIRTNTSITDLAGNKVDQNGNGKNGESGLLPAGDEFQATGRLNDPNATTGAKITAAAFGGAAANTFNRVDVTFDRPLDASGFLPSDVAVILNPQGDPIPVDSVTQVAGSPAKFTVGFASQSVAGMYTLVIASTVVDQNGNELDQNLNGINGEVGDSPAGDDFVVNGTLSGGGGTPPANFFAVGGSDGAVRLIDSATGTAAVSGLRLLDAAGSQYKGLVQVAVGDLNKDGVADLFVSAASPSGGAGLDASKAGRVFAFDGAALFKSSTATLLQEYIPFATTDGPAGTADPFTNGLNIAVGDVNGDGTIDLIAGTRGGNGSAGGGLRESGRLVVIDGTSPAGSNNTIGDIQKPFGAGYEKGVVVSVGNADGTGGVEIAVTRGGPVASPDAGVQKIKVKVLQLQGAALTELKLAADGATAFAPFGALTGPANGIKRDGRVAFVDADGDGKAELVVSALDPLTDPANGQVRVGVYSIDPTAATGAAAIVSTGPDDGTYVTGKAVADHAIADVLPAGGQQSLALLTRSATSGIVYVAPLTGTVRTGGSAFTVATGGITIDGI